MKRKWIRRVSWILLTPVLLFVILMILLYIPPVQNLLRREVTAYASKATGMQIQVERIDLRFPLNLLVRGVEVIQQPVVFGKSERACTGMAARQGKGRGR
mgnify:CR=1 FL=1